jgi:nucleoside-diphosphate-sugar epimerase
MRVLVTGASGLLGSHVAELLSERGTQVRALVRKTSDRRHLATLRNVELFEGSVEQPDRVREAVDGVDAIIHAAGLVKARNTDEFFATNVGGTSNLIDAARRRGRPLDKFVYVSSLEACGPSSDGTPVPAEQENPLTRYGRSKLAAEKVVLSAKDQVPSVILRPGAIYGPRDREILAVFQTIKRGLLPLVAGGAAKAVWIYATDCAEACIRAIDAPVAGGRSYFVDDGCGPLDQRQLFDDAERALGKKALVRANLPTPLVQQIARGVEVFGRITNRPVMFTREKANMLIQHWVCSSEETRKDLGWEPRVRWADGIRRTMTWYRENGWL